MITLLLVIFTFWIIIKLISTVENNSGLLMLVIIIDVLYRAFLLLKALFS